MATQKTPRPIDQINTAPGVTRDGTTLSSMSYVDATWTRFQRNKPKKIGGYKEVTKTLPSVVRGSLVFPSNGLFYLYGFGSEKCFTSVTNSDISTSVASETTFPALAAGDLYTYQADKMFDATGGAVSRMVVHPAQNIADIDSTDETSVYIADLGANPPVFSKVTDGSGGDITTDGGIVVVHPYLLVYGSNGRVRNSNANTPNNFITGPGKAADDATVAGSKVVKGLPIRGSGATSAVLLWSLDSLVKGTFRSGVGFSYDTVSSQTSIIAPNSAIEYDGAFYWIGIDRFLVYNGRVQEVRNEQNFNWFFDGLNYTQRAKIWATKVPKYGEIWWFFPRGTNTECSHAIVYNVQGGFWFDVELPRSAGNFAQVLRYPTMYGSAVNAGDLYSLYAHEFGVNAIENGREVAIKASFETSDFGYPTGGASGEKAVGDDYWTRLVRIEPDAVQAGEIKVRVHGEEFARGTDVVSTDYSFTPSTGKVDTREQRRQIRLEFESNELDGDFEMGRTIIHTERGDTRS